MIVYLATFPRCGHALTRNLVLRNLGYVTANGYPAPPNANPKLQFRSAHAPVEGFAAGLVWNEHTLVYRAPRKGGLRRALGNGALDFLTPDLREPLAAEANLFFVKTHEPPQASWFRGEVAIQMVRHPGAAIASHMHLLESFEEDRRPVRELFRGEPGQWGWSEYHKAWGRAALPRLRLRYEDAVSDQPAAVRAMAEFLGLAAPADIIPSDLDEARALNPRRNPGAGIDGWRKDFSPAELEDLWRLHGPLARTFGYGRDVTVAGGAPWSAEAVNA